MKNLIWMKKIMFLEQRPSLVSEYRSKQYVIEMSSEYWTIVPIAQITFNDLNGEYQSN